MVSAKKKLPTGASELLRAAMSLYTFFQSILLGKLACCVTVLVGIRCGQTEREPSLADFKLHAARFRVCVGLAALAGVSCGIGGQPVLEVGVVGSVLWVRIWIRGSFSSNQISVVFSCFVSPVLINSPFCPLSHRSGIFRLFSPDLDLGKTAIFKQERAGRCLPCLTRSHSIKCVFSGSTQESASFVPRDRFFSERMEESPQIITLNYILIAADFPA